MNDNGVTPAPANTEDSTEGHSDSARFSAGTYFKRTREVLKEKTGEASKLQADTRAALMGVWQDLRADIQTELSSLSANVTKRAEALREKVPFVAKKAAEKTEETETTKPAA